MSDSQILHHFFPEILIRLESLLSQITFVTYISISKKKKINAVKILTETTFHCHGKPGRTDGTFQEHGLTPHSLQACACPSLKLYNLLSKRS